MDDLLREFLTETNESLDRVDAKLVRFEREPNNRASASSIPSRALAGFLGCPGLRRWRTPPRV